MSPSLSALARSRVCRQAESGCDHIAVSHGHWTEHFLNLTPLPDEPPMAIFSRLASVLRDAEITVLKQTILGSCAVRDSAMTALHAAWPRVDWPVTWIEGADCSGAPLAGLQVHGVSGVETETLWWDNRPVGKTFDADAARYAIIGDVRPPDPTASRRDQAYRCFRALESVLDECGLSFRDVVRTWLFVDRILDWYDDLNAARNEYFAERRVWDGLVPASTGIGVGNPYGAALVVDALAIRTDRGEPAADPVPSPLQGPAPAYGSAFGRAVETQIGGGRRVLVSGTASIAPDGRTAHIGDAPAQVARTLDVVEAILRSRAMCFEDVTRAIAYFRHPGDAPLLRRVLLDRGTGRLPLVTVQADVCRDDLLFEIEVDAIA